MVKRSSRRRWSLLAGTAAVVMIVAGLSEVSAQAAPATDNDKTLRQADFSAAAKEFSVPEPVLLAVSYLASRWDGHAGQPSVSGGYGPMHLTDNATARFSATGHDHLGGDSRGDQARPIAGAAVTTKRSAAPNVKADTLPKAAAAAGRPTATVRTDPRENVRAGAALLAADARRLGHGALPTNLAGWRPAIKALAGSDEAYANEVYDVLRTGQTRTTAEGQRITLAAQPSLRSAKPALKGKAGIECPPGLGCDFVAAAYAKSGDGKDPGNYGNYDTARRPVDLKINTIVIHDTEETYADTLKIFTDPNRKVAAHYVVRSNDGHVTQMVKNQHVGFQAGNWYVNTHSIGIEHEGYAEAGGTWYTEAMYRSSAKLVRYLSLRYGVPLDRQHIIGHDNVQGLLPNKVAGMHWDPGAHWNWRHYFELLGAPLDRAKGGPKSKVVTILPAANRTETLTKCAKPEPLPGKGTSTVQLRTEPRDAAPLLSDPALHPDGAAGTTKMCDWGDKASAGQRYVVAARKGDWTAIWYAGQKGWFRDAKSAPASVPGRGPTVTPKRGKATIPVFGAAYPNANEFPTEIAAQPPVALQYTLKAGQSYVTSGPSKADYYYAQTIDSSKPLDHTVVRGKETFYRIQLGHRIGFVRAADVTVKPA